MSRKLILAFFPLLAGCGVRLPRAEPERTIPASILVWARKGSGVKGLDAEAAARELARGLRAGRVFSEVSTEEERAASGFRPDLIGEVEVLGRGIDVGGSVATEQAAISTTLWACALPPWWIDDRRYPRAGVEIGVRIFRAGAADGGRRAHRLCAALAEPELDLWRRGSAGHLVLSLFVPSFWMEDPGRAAEAIRERALDAARVELAEAVREEWPAVALRGEPGCFLLLDATGALALVPKVGVDISAWLVSSEPPLEARILDADGRVLRRLDRTALAAPIEPEILARFREGADWDRLVARVDDDAEGPRYSYRRLDLSGLPATGARLHLEVRTSRKGPPARFTVLLQREE